VKIISIVFMLLLSLVAKAAAADTYQIIPTETATSADLHTHGYQAIVLNITTGDIRYCNAVYDSSTNPGTIISHNCVKDQVVTGPIPPGPAELATYNMQHKAVAPAFWKVDQSTGNVTFCARFFGNPIYLPSKWVCGRCNPCG
jgi:hypothetical protein